MHHALAPRAAPARVLVVEDDAIDARRIATVLDAYGYDVDAVRTAEQAILLDPRRYALVVCDFRLPGIDGKTLADIVREEEGDAAPPFLFVSTGPAEPLAHESWLEKPFSMRELVGALAVALGMHASGVFLPPSARSADAAAPSSCGGSPPDGGGRRGTASH